MPGPLRNLTISTAPPSMNNSTAVIRGRKVKSKAYREWRSAAEAELITQTGIGSAPGYWRADILIPGKVKSDIDNLPKAIFDAIRAAEKVPDDRYLVDYRVRFWEQSTVNVAIRREEVTTWAKIKGASRRLTLKLAKSMG